jgi:hypothetical protein
VTIRISKIVRLGTLYISTQQGLRTYTSSVLSLEATLFLTEWLVIPHMHCFSFGTAIFFGRATFSQTTGEVINFEGLQVAHDRKLFTSHGATIFEKRASFDGLVSVRMKISVL